jgi:alcohol dehydrogenase class IV
VIIPPVRQRTFTWLDGERTIRFGRGTATEAIGVLGGPGYALLTTPRARAVAPDVVEAASTVIEVAPGRVDELAGGLLGTIVEDRLVALGGGRVIDVAKALAAASGGAQRAMAIPTTLSGAEMTRIHRQAAGAPYGTTNVRPAVVVNDPALSASQPEPQLAASAANALGHAAEGPCTPRSNPVSTLAALEATRLIAAAYARPGEPNRDTLALGALLAGSVIDSTVYGLHHVLAQSLVRVAGISHGQANAIMLPHTLSALEWRFSAWYERLGEVLERDPSEFAGRLCDRSGTTALGELGIGPDKLDECADAAAERAELDLTPPRADRAELRAIYDQAH